MIENELGHLHDLAVFLRAEEDLGAHLGELVERAASVTDAASCSIMLLSEGEAYVPRLKLWCSTETLPLSAWNERPGRGDSIAGWVLEQRSPLLIADIKQSKFAPMARHRRSVGASFICTPITVKNMVIGVMNLSNRPGSPPFNESHLVLADITATLIGKSVQVERLQTLIRSRVAQLTLAREEKEVIARLTDGTLAHARVAKMLAKSFFKDMSAAGFEPGQIIDAASEIITLVSSDIARYKKRIARTSK